MQSFDLQNFRTINTILSRDSKDTTCRYALLHGGGRDDPARNQHLKHENGDRAFVPAGAACREMAAVLLPVH